MNTCKTSVETGRDNPLFRQCGKPATESVSVGLLMCHYCAEHGSQARKYVEKQGQKKISDIQRRTGAA